MIPRVPKRLIHLLVKMEHIYMRDPISVSLVPQDAKSAQMVILVSYARLLIINLGMSALRSVLMDFFLIPLIPPVKNAQMAVLSVPVLPLVKFVKKVFFWKKVNVSQTVEQDPFGTMTLMSALLAVKAVWNV